MTDDERAIRQLVDDWMAGVRAGDTAKVLDLIDDEALFLTVEGEPFGKDAFKAHSEQENMRIEPTNVIEEVAVVGDLAYMRSFLDVTVTRPGGGSVRRTGHALTILRKDSTGKWRVYRDANLLTAKE